MKEEKIKLDARRAISGGYGGNVYGGNELKHKPTVYGLAFKYILHLRGISYREAAKALAMSPQSLNYALNRMSEKNFDYALIQRICVRLRLNEDYLYALSAEIERQLNEKKEIE